MKITETSPKDKGIPIKDIKNGMTFRIEDTLYMKVEIPPKLLKRIYPEHAEDCFIVTLGDGCLYPQSKNSIVCPVEAEITVEKNPDYENPIH